MPLILILVSGALACSDPPSVDLPIESVVDGVVDAAPCSAAFVVDGAFTNWPGRSGCWEWETVPSSTTPVGSVYLAYDGATLHVLSDRHASDAPFSAEDVAVFALTTGDGQEQWEIRVQGNGYIHVARNGYDYAKEVVGAVGFAGSPQSETPHAIVEFALQVLPGAFVLGVDESTVHAGFLSDEQVDTFAHQGPLLVSISAARGVGGDEVTLHGVGLGTEGQVTFDGSKATAISWSPSAIVVVVPPIAEDRDVVVWVQAVATNPLRFFYDCHAACQGDACAACPSKNRCAICPDDGTCFEGFCGCVSQCGDRNCGSDGCGGICGNCLPTELCAGGTCMCKTKCGSDNTCGPDGCGGVCGLCPKGDKCFVDLCCTPTCEQKQCGTDGCGGDCGSCPSDYLCINNACVCQPKCGGKQCGFNGCGGLCGTCYDNYVCEGGLCICQPQCINELGQQMECGHNGCGEQCGICPDGHKCTKIGLCSAT